MDCGLIKSSVSIPSWWRSQEMQIRDFIEHSVIKGEIKTLAVSPGGREIKAVFYGEQETALKGTANFTSAVAAGDSEYYYRKRERKRPVLVLLAGVHGQELESMVYTTSLIKLMETGTDLQGMENPSLLKKLKELRLIIIPVANPDGRLRVPYDGWVGLPEVEMTKYGQGTRKNGELYGWLKSMSVHPMQDDIGILGGYFDDCGINMQVDDWSSPMSATTKAVLGLAGEEGPDMLINMHGHNWDPSILPVAYVPKEVRQELFMLESEYKKALQKSGYGYRDLNVLTGENSRVFSLTSLLYHQCGGLCYTFECPHGCYDLRMPDGKPYGKHTYGYEDIMKVQEHLISCATDYLTSRSGSLSIKKPTA